MSTPVMKFRAGENGTLMGNVNFARSMAEAQANETGQNVPVYQVTESGSAAVIQVMEPDRVLRLVE